MSTNVSSLNVAAQHASPSTRNLVLNSQQARLDERATNALMRKIDLRLMPLLTLLLFFNYLNRISIGHAYHFGLENYLQLSPSEYNWAVSIFYIPYVLCGVPSNLLMRRLSPSKWIAILMFTLGVIIMSMTLIQNLAGLLVARFCLGLVEAGFVPGAIFYLSLWYIRKDQAFRMGIFMSGGILAFIFDGLLGSITIEQTCNQKCLTVWRWLLLAEGMSTVCVAIVTFKFLADPTTVRWLDQCEKDILTTRLLADTKVIGDAENELFSHQIRSAFLDWKVLLYIIVYTGVAAPRYGTNVLLPEIIKDTFYTNATNATNANIDFLTIPPFFASFLTTIISCWNAGRLNERSNHIMISLLIEIIGFLYLIVVKKYLYIGAIIIGTGLFSSTALSLSWITNNIGGKTKRAVVTALVIPLGAIAEVFGQQIYPESDGNVHTQRHWIVIGILCFTLIFVLSLKLLLKYKNKQHRNLTKVQFQKETVIHKNKLLFEKHPDFVYVT